MERFIEPIILGVVSGVLTWLICLGISRYWSNRSIKSLNRRIQESEAEKVKLDNLAKSDKALIIHGFQGVFAIIAVLCMMFALQTLIFVGPPGFINLRDVPLVLLWLIPTLLCVGIVKLLQNVADYPKSAEKIDERIAKLKDKLSRR